MNILKYIVANLLTYTYHPSKMDVMPYTMTDTSLEDKFNKAIELLDTTQYLNNGDGAKFIGLLSASDPTNNEWWGLVKLFWYDKYFIRYVDLDQVKVGVNFSGDMITGMCEAIYARHLTVGLSLEEMGQLQSIFDSTIFQAPTYQFKHPFSTAVDRGFLLSSFALTNEVLQTLAFLALAIELFKDQKYKDEYDRIKKDNEYLLNGAPDCAFFLGRAYFASWYDEHSSMVIYTLGFRLTGEEFFEKAATFLKERYKNQPEIQGYYFKYINKADITIKEFAKSFLINYDFDKSPIVPDDFLINYFSIRSFCFKKMSKYILLPKYRGGLYMWEGKDIEPSIGSNSCTIDFIHLYSLVE